MPSSFNLNGIDATPDGKALVVVQSVNGKLFNVIPATGATSEIDLGGATVANGDGLLLHGRTLYVVQNRLNQIAVVSLGKNLASGRVARTITDSDFDVPTTVDRHGSLYAVNARFGTAPTPSTTYSVGVAGAAATGAARLLAYASKSHGARDLHLRGADPRPGHGVGGQPR